MTVARIGGAALTRTPYEDFVNGVGGEPEHGADCIESALGAAQLFGESSPAECQTQALRKADQELAIIRVDIRGLLVLVSVEQADDPAPGNNGCCDVRPRLRCRRNRTVDSVVGLNVVGQQPFSPTHYFRFKNAGSELLWRFLPSTVDLGRPLLALRDEDSLGNPQPVFNSGNDGAVETEFADEPWRGSDQIIGDAAERLENSDDSGKLPWSRNQSANAV